MPLIGVAAVVLDLETTGLDTRTACIVEVGASAVADGQLTEKEQLSYLVNPGEALPKGQEQRYARGEFPAPYQVGSTVNIADCLDWETINNVLPFSRRNR